MSVHAVNDAPFGCATIATVGGWWMTTFRETADTTHKSREASNSSEEVFI